MSAARSRWPATKAGSTARRRSSLLTWPTRRNATTRATLPRNYGYCVFGEITEGLDVADKISQSPTADQGGDLAQTPDPPVVIKSVRLVR